MAAKRIIFVGYDPDEDKAFRVAVHSIRRRLSKPIPIIGLYLERLQKSGWYTRPTRRDATGLYDELSVTKGYDGRMSTEFAISRFFVPRLCEYEEGVLAMFIDCDVLGLCDFNEIFDLCDPRDAISCVQHRHLPIHYTKMDGLPQTQYARKNWSSMMVFSCDHPVHKTLESVLNEWPGRDLHAFAWCPTHLIGPLPPTYNHLVGDSVHDPNAKVVHFTNGGPWHKEHSDLFKAEWLAEWDHMHLLTTASLLQV